MLKGLLRRRVPQILGLYLGGCWVAVEALDFLTERYLLSDALTDAVLVAALAMTPAVLLVAWYHGTPGKERWVMAEKILVPVNALIAAGLLWLMFHGQDLGATTTTVEAVDERGQAISRQVPKASFRERLGLFFLDNASGDPALDWLQHGLTVMLDRDLLQDPFIDAWSPLEGFEQSGLLSLRRAGFADGLHAPIPLLREIARRRDLAWFLAGRYTSGDDGIRIDAQLYPTDGRSDPVALPVTAPDPLAAVDALAAAIRARLDLPVAAERMTADLPVAEHFTAGVAAARLYVAGRVADSIHNDSDAAVAHWLRAGEEDRSFAAAHLRAAATAFNAGRMDQSARAIEAARRHDYKLLPQEEFNLKAVEYFIAGHSELITSVYATWVQLYPYSVEALAQLAFARLYRDNDVDGAIATLERIREVDPNERWVLRELAELRSVRGDIDGALALLARYSSEQPDDYRPALVSARIRMGTGDLARAREDLRRALLLSSGRVDPLIELARLNLREGRYDEALARIADARRVASVPQQRAAVLRAEFEYYRHRGMLDEMVERMDAIYEVEKTFRSPINLMMNSRLCYVDQYARAGKHDFVMAELERLEEHFEPPLNELVQIGYLTYFLTTGDLEQARFTAARVRRLMENFRREDKQYLNDMADARLAELAGNYTTAIAAAERSLAKFRESVQSSESFADRIVLHNGLARYRIQTGDLETAEQSVRRVLDVYPAEPEANLLLARIKLDQGDEAAARRALQTTLSAWNGASERFDLAQEARELATRL